MNQLQALADPTRRRIVELLTEKDHTAGELVGVFAISQPAVSRHLRVLRETGLVEVVPEAQRRIYRLLPDTFDDLAEWIETCRQTWVNRLDALETELHRGTQRKRNETR